MLRDASRAERRPCCAGCVTCSPTVRAAAPSCKLRRGASRNARSRLNQAAAYLTGLLRAAEAEASAAWPGKEPCPPLRSAEHPACAPSSAPRGTRSTTTRTGCAATRDRRRWTARRASHRDHRSANHARRPGPASRRDHDEPEGSGPVRGGWTESALAGPTLDAWPTRHRTHLLFTPLGLPRLVTRRARKYSPSAADKPRSSGCAACRESGRALGGAGAPVVSIAGPRATGRRPPGLPRTSARTSLGAGTSPRRTSTRKPFDSGASSAPRPENSRILSAPGSPIPGKVRSMRFARAGSLRSAAATSPPHSSEAIRAHSRSFAANVPFRIPREVTASSAVRPARRIESGEVPTVFPELFEGVEPPGARGEIGARSPRGRARPGRSSAAAPASRSASRGPQPPPSSSSPEASSSPSSPLTWTPRSDGRCPTVPLANDFENSVTASYRPSVRSRLAAPLPRYPE